MQKRSLSEEDSENNSQLGNLKRTCLKTLSASTIHSNSGSVDMEVDRGTSINTSHLSLETALEPPKAAPPSFQDVRLDYDIHPGLMRRFLNGSFY